MSQSLREQVAKMVGESEELNPVEVSQAAAIYRECVALFIMFADGILYLLR